MDLKASLRLFKSVPIANKTKAKADKALLEMTIRKGFIFSPEVVSNYHESLLDDVIEVVESIYGLTPERLNASFHKSWAKIRDTEMEQLVVEQIAHYLTTYGQESPAEYVEEKGEQWGVDNLGGKILALDDFESNKIKDENYVYIPQEKLHIPLLEGDGIKLVVIKGLTKDELREKLLNLLSLGVALAEDTMKDVVTLAKDVGFNHDEVGECKNKEVKIMLYRELEIVPYNATEFLRYAVYEATGKTLLIKSKGVIEQIKEDVDTTVYQLFYKYDKQHGLEKLAEIFYRFKPIFLAFRECDDRIKPIINKIRRLAVEYHKPMKEDYLNNVTHKLKSWARMSAKTKETLESELKKVNTFRKVRLAYALKFRTKDIDSILYRIRNGKSYATSFSFTHHGTAKKVLDIILDSIAEDMALNVADKDIYIPSHIHYTLPATEKMFTGNFPSGTYVDVEKDMLFGINWNNVDGHRIDLDLSVSSLKSGKIGWDTSYRSDDSRILFSGDITDARGENGATELFYVGRQAKDALALNVNYFNFMEDVEVPFKIIVAKKGNGKLKPNYMVDPNEIIVVVDTKINQHQKMLGLAIITTSGGRFYFAESYTEKSITSRNTKHAEHARKYLLAFYENTISLRDVLKRAGANIIESPWVEESVVSDDYIDLSPEMLEKDTILNLLKKA